MVELSPANLELGLELSPSSLLWTSQKLLVVRQDPRMQVRPSGRVAEVSENTHLSVFFPNTWTFPVITWTLLAVSTGGFIDKTG